MLSGFELYTRWVPLWQTGMVRTGLVGPTTTTHDRQTLGVVCHTLELSLAQTWPMRKRGMGQIGPQ